MHTNKFTHNTPTNTPRSTPTNTPTNTSTTKVNKNVALSLIVFFYNHILIRQVFTTFLSKYVEEAYNKISQRMQYAVQFAVLRMYFSDFFTRWCFKIFGISIVTSYVCLALIILYQTLEAKEKENEPFLNFFVGIDFKHSFGSLELRILLRFRKNLANFKITK